MENRIIQMTLIILAITLISLPAVFQEQINNIFYVLSYQFIGVILLVCGLKFQFPIPEKY